MLFPLVDIFHFLATQWGFFLPNSTWIFLYEISPSSFWALWFKRDWIHFSWLRLSFFHLSYSLLLPVPRYTSNPVRSIKAQGDMETSLPQVLPVKIFSLHLEGVGGDLESGIATAILLPQVTWSCQWGRWDRKEGQYGMWRWNWHREVP